MAAMLMQHNLLKQFGDILQVLPRSVFFSTVCVKAFFFFSRQKWGHNLNCKETHPDNSDLFTILQIKGTKSSKYF